FEPQDEALVASGDSAGVAAVVEAGCVIVFGDVFFSHPVLARQIIDAKYTARGNNLFVVDPRRSNTAWFASEYVQNRPGSEALVLAAMVKALVGAGKGTPGQAAWLDAIDEKALLERSGVSRGTVARMARSFAEAAKGAIVVAPSVRGLSDVGLVARLARLAVALAGEGKSYLGLPSEGNVKGAYKASVDGGWKPLSALMSELTSGRFKALVSTGVDLLSAYPSAALEKAVSGLDFVASYSLFRDGLEDKAAVVLPGATWLESDGSAVLFDGSPVSWKTVGRPSWGARTLPDVVAMLEKALGAPARGGAARQPVRKPAAPPEWSATVLRARLESVLSAAGAKSADVKALIAVPASGHSGVGGITRRMDWANELFPTGVAELSARDAAELGVKDGDSVVLASESARPQFTARVTDRLQAGVVSVAAHDPLGRALFSWQSLDDGVFSTAPGSVRIARESKQ
ncbi:MAG: molybdopterin-dependent oxidoreductase, partial [Dehalococcoidia bacterium]|nr:molybdopterin-dependent oxidoreductase [Dehalococcoidia bacterium]